MIFFCYKGKVRRVFAPYLPYLRFILIYAFIPVVKSAAMFVFGRAYRPAYRFAAAYRVADDGFGRAFRFLAEAASQKPAYAVEQAIAVPFVVKFVETVAFVAFIEIVKLTVIKTHYLLSLIYMCRKNT
jgi:hypothetical protein